MDDREIVAALAAGDPDGVAGAYDAYAGSIYGYCRWMLAEPGDAAEAVRDTFALAARELGHRLRDPTKMRLWLFRTARSECLRRPRAGAAGTNVDGDDDVGGDGGSPSQEAADLRRLIRATLATLTADEREAVELSLWHDLDDVEVAAMLGVSPERAYALVGNGHRQLEETLGALRIARTRRETCPELNDLLAGHDERLTVGVLKLVGQHVAQCEGCGAGQSGTLRPEALTRLLPLPVPPADLREQVLELAAASMAGAGAAGVVGADAVAAGEPAGVAATAQVRPPVPVTAARSWLAPRAGAGLAVVLAGWGQRAVRVRAAGWSLMRRSPRATVAALAVLVVVAASVTLITSSEAHAARNPAGRSDGSTAGTSGPGGTSGAGTIAGPGANVPPSPKRSGQASPGPASFLAPSPTSPGRVTPSKSPRPTPPGSVTLPSASASSSPSEPPSSSPAPTRTHSASPSPTPTDSPTPTSSPTPTDSPTSPSSATPTDTST